MTKHGRGGGGRNIYFMYTLNDNNNVLSCIRDKYRVDDFSITTIINMKLRVVKYF